MKALIVDESMYGNTHLIAEGLADLVESEEAVRRPGVVR
jgi:hypothetical protein